MSKLIIDAAKDNIFLMIINSTIYSVTHQNSKTNYDKLIVLINDSLKKNNLRLNDMESIYINRGPGSFAGIRNSLSVIKAIHMIKEIDYYCFSFDDFKGEIASNGSVNIDLLEQLNSLDYYRKSFPKSLAWEWVVDQIIPLLYHSSLSSENQMRTFVEHSAIQISSVVKYYDLKSVLLTGGGTYHDFLLKRLEDLLPDVWMRADASLIESKEAMAFAFLGLLKLKGQNNVLSSVTGSVKNHSSGRIYNEEL
mgnify:CR=1 FL=1